MDGNEQLLEVTENSGVFERKAEEIIQSFVALTAEFRRALAEADDARLRLLQDLDTTREEKVIREAEMEKAQAEVRRLRDAVEQLEAQLPVENEAREPEPAEDQQSADPPGPSTPDSETIEGPKETAVLDDTEGEEKEDAATKPNSQQYDLQATVKSVLAGAEEPSTLSEEEAPETDEDAISEELHPTTKLKRRNRELSEEKEHLLVQVDDLDQQLCESSAKVQRLSEDKEDLESQLAEARDKSAALEIALAAAQDKIKGQEEQIEERRRELSGRDKRLHKLTTRLRRHEQKLEVATSDNARLKKDLQAACDESKQLRQDLDAATEERSKLEQNLEETGMDRKRIQHDLGICESARQQLILQIEEVQQEARRIREQSGWEIVSALGPVLTKLSTLAHLEPQQTKGLSERAVFEEFRDLIARTAGGRLEAFPTKQELSGETLWLDPDQVDLAELLERYDWTPDHPFEGLPKGERRLPFRLSRRGWCVGGRVLARARVIPQPIPADTDSQPPAGDGSDEAKDR